MKKKILMISCDYPPAIGGASIVARDTVSNLSKQGYELTLVTHHIKERVIEDEFNINEVKFIRYIWPFKYWQTLKKMPLNEYKTIILNDIGANLVASLFFSVKLQNKCISYLHGSEPESILQNKSLLKGILGIRKKYLKLLKNAKAIIAVSEFMKNKFLEYSKMYDLEKKIIVVYNGIDTSWFYKELFDVKKTHNIGNEYKTLLTVSRIVKRKGLDEMYLVFKELIKKGEKYHWIIIGEGDYLDTFVEAVKRDNLEDYITFLGKIYDRELLRKYYSSVDVFWLLSNFEEALGLVYIESLACGVPVIGNNNAGVKEIIEDKSNGFLINNLEECINILIEKQYMCIQASDISNNLNKFSMESNINRIKKIIDS